MFIRKNIFALFVLSCISLSIAQSDTHYREIVLPIAIKSADVKSILEDRNGFFWFGTSDGLYRFDGIDFKPYLSEYGNKETILDNEVWSLLEDRHGRIWIGTKSGGLSILDPITNRFTHFRAEKNDSTALGSNFISAIFEDRQGTIWIGTQGGGLSKYNAKKNSFKNYVKDESKKGSISQNYVNSISEDATSLWLGLNGKGIDRFDFKTEEFENFDLKVGEQKRENFRNNVIRDIHHDEIGNIWIATYGGFNKLEKRTGKYTHYNKYNSALRSNSLNSIDQGKEVLYITSFDGFVYTFDYNKEEFVTTDVLQSNIRSSYVASDMLLWLGLTNSKVKFTLPSTDFEYHKISQKNWITAIVKTDNGTYFGNNGTGIYNADGGVLEQLEKTSNYVVTLEETNNGKLWMGTASNGITIYEPDTGKKSVLRYEPGNKESLLHDTVIKIYQDAFGTVWICTLGGLSEWNSRTKRMINRGVGYRFSDVVRLNKHELWAATNAGIAVIDPTTNDFYMKSADPEQLRDSIIHNDVQALFSSSPDSILIGTKGGLNLYLRKDQKMVNVHNQMNLPYCSILAITQDQYKNYWMVTDKGVLQLNFHQKRFKFLDKSDGLNYTTFAGSSILFDDKINKILVGGLHGYYEFEPKKVDFKKAPIPVRIKTIKLSNEVLHDTVQLKRIHNENYLELSYHQRMISFSYAALNYKNPLKTQYAYRLDGLNEDWIYTNERVATFTNLSPGSYRFMVKATNNDGVWNTTPTFFNFSIRPPLWATWWAYVLYGLLFLLILYGVIRSFVLRERLKTNLKLEHLEVEKMQEINAVKSHFFTNISHELRTPLTLILGPVEDLLQQVSNTKMKNNIEIIQRNSVRLKRLIDQLLDFSKLESKALEVRESKGRILLFLKTISSSFSSLARTKGINYRVTILPSPQYAIYDEEKIEMITSNLISNALKFTPAKGSVSIEANLEMDTYKSNLLISVSDTGPGLSEKQREKIFERFYRLATHETYEGTGIGLTLTKELVELMNGTIEVQSKIGKGTRFLVTLPLHLASDPLLKKNSKKKNESHTTTSVALETQLLNSATILVVEDNEDLRNYISNILSNEYHILKAVNGKEGMRLASEAIPDLIISDFMMPQMEGDLLCKTLKQDERTSHIPFIMLTAKASEEDMLIGLDFGADEYLTKPFNKNELKLRVRNLLQHRERLRRKLQQGVVQLLAPENLDSAEDRFIRKLQDLILKNLAKSNLNIAFLSKEIGLSRVQLYRKVLALTGLSTSDFIRKIRIAKATELLKSNWGSVSEIAYEVGFNNLSYFSKCFKETHQTTPSQFILKQ